MGLKANGFVVSQVAEAYLETRVLTASPVRLHLMVVEGAIRGTLRGKAALAAGDREQTSLHLGKARDCVAELLAGLRPDEAPELIGTTKALLAFVLRSLAEADLHQRASSVDDALRVLAAYRETWKELCDQIEATGTRPPASGRAELPGNSVHPVPPEPHVRSWSA